MQAIIVGSIIGIAALSVYRHLTKAVTGQKPCDYCDAKESCSSLPQSKEG